MPVPVKDWQIPASLWLAGPRKFRFLGLRFDYRGISEDRPVVRWAARTYHRREVWRAVIWGEYVPQLVLREYPEFDLCSGKEGGRTR